MAVLAEIQPNIFELQHQFEIRSKKKHLKINLISSVVCGNWRESSGY